MLPRQRLSTFFQDGPAAQQLLSASAGTASVAVSGSRIRTSDL